MATTITIHIDFRTPEDAVLSPPGDMAVIAQDTQAMNDFLAPLQSHPQDTRPGEFSFERDQGTYVATWDTEVVGVNAFERLVTAIENARQGS